MAVVARKAAWSFGIAKPGYSIAAADYYRKHDTDGREIGFISLDDIKASGGTPQRKSIKISKYYLRTGLYSYATSNGTFFSEGGNMPMFRSFF